LPFFMSTRTLNCTAALAIQLQPRCRRGLPPAHHPSLLVGTRCPPSSGWLPHRHHPQRWCCLPLPPRTSLLVCPTLSNSTVVPPPSPS
jgi:hypothetical protein